MYSQIIWIETEGNIKFKKYKIAFFLFFQVKVKDMKTIAALNSRPPSCMHALHDRQNRAGLHTRIWNNLRIK